MKSIIIMGLLLIAAIYGISRMDQWANAGMTTRGEYSFSLRTGVTAFHIRVDSPHKIILYPESQKVRSSYSIICTKNGKFSYNARTFDTPFTRNLLYKIAPNQDRCDLAIAAATPSHKGQIVIDVMDH